MVSFGDSWIQQYNEAGKLVDDISNMISEKSSVPATGPEAQRHSSSIKRKITILGTRLDSLQSIDSMLPGKQRLTEKEMNCRKDMLANLKSKATQVASTLNMSNLANRDSLLGPETKAADAMSRTTGLDNYGVVGLQRQIMKEQDDGLEKLQETVMSTKHIALAVNEELDLQTRLIGTLDEHVDVTDSKLQRVGRKLAILNKRTKGGCSCMCMLLSVIGIVLLVAVIYMLIRGFYGKTSERNIVSLRKKRVSYHKIPRNCKKWKKKKKTIYVLCLRVLKWPLMHTLPFSNNEAASFCILFDDFGSEC